jgi:hypothetical protein
MQGDKKEPHAWGFPCTSPLDWGVERKANDRWGLHAEYYVGNQRLEGLRMCANKVTEQESESMGWIQPAREWSQ